MSGSIGVSDDLSKRSDGGLGGKVGLAGYYFGMGRADWDEV